MLSSSGPLSSCRSLGWMDDGFRVVGSEEMSSLHIGCEMYEGWWVVGWEFCLNEDDSAGRIACM